MEILLGALSGRVHFALQGQDVQADDPADGCDRLHRRSRASIGVMPADQSPTGRKDVTVDQGPAFCAGSRSVLATTAYSSGILDYATRAAELAFDLVEVEGYSALVETTPPGAYAIEVA